MLCQWQPYGDKYKCKNCGFVVPNKNIKKNCTSKPKPKREKQPPKATKKLQNFGKATAKHIKTGMKYCTQEQKQERFEICKSNKCGLFRRKDKNNGICAHDDCGCPIRSQGKFIDKLSWASSSCPKGLWGPINRNS